MQYIVVSCRFRKIPQLDLGAEDTADPMRGSVIFRSATSKRAITEELSRE